jgi:hypothetical protein
VAIVFVRYASFDQTAMPTSSPKTSHRHGLRFRKKVTELDMKAILSGKATSFGIVCDTNTANLARALR